MLESTQSQEVEPIARCSKARKVKRGAVSKMLESAQSQEPLASSRKHIKLIGGAVGKMRENTQSQEGEPLARCSKAHKVKRESR